MMKRLNEDFYSLKSGIPQNAAAVYLMSTSLGSSAYILRPGHAVEEVLLKVTREEIKSWVQDDYAPVYRDESQRWHSNETGRLPAAFSAMLEKVWYNILGPIDQRLNEIGMPPHAEVILIMPGLLNTLPIGWSGPNLRGTHPGTSFGDNWSVSSMPSLRTLAHQMKWRNCCNGDRVSALAMLDPTSVGQYSLPGAHIDGTGLRQQMKDKCLILPNDLATKRAFLKMASDHTIIHLAMHASVNLNDPALSCLYFEEDQVLTLAEVRDGPRLNGARIFLNVCELGISSHPVGLVSFPLAFVAKGAASVVAPHVPIPDDVSALLSIFYYRELLNDGMIKVRASQALRRASLRLRNITVAELCALFEPAKDAAGWEVPASIDTARPKTHPLDHDIALQARPLEGPGDTNTLEAKHARIKYEKAVRHTTPGAILFDADCGVHDRPFRDPMFWAAFSVTGL